MAEALLRAKFSKGAADRLFDAARRFLAAEGNPWGRFLNDPRLERFDSALKALIEATDSLPSELRGHQPPEPRQSDVPAALHEAMVRAAAGTEYAEERLATASGPEREEAKKARLEAYALYDHTRRRFGIVPVDQFRDVLVCWRSSIRIDGNQPDPSDIDSVLAARKPDVRFVAAVMRRDTLPFNRKVDESVTGNDMALLSICCGFEVHTATTDFDKVIERWKKAVKRTKKLFQDIKETRLRRSLTILLKDAREAHRRAISPFGFDPETAEAAYHAAVDAKAQLQRLGPEPKTRLRAARRPR